MNAVTGQFYKKKADSWKKFQRCATEIVNRKIRLADNFDQYIDLGLEIASTFGEKARDYYHHLCAICDKYDYDDCNKRYDSFLKDSRGEIGIGSFFLACANAGISIKNLPEDYARCTQLSHNSATNATKKMNGPNLLKVQTANQVINESLLAPPRKQFYYGTICEKELTIICGDNGIGKTIFAMNMNISLAQQGLKCLYADLELSDTQFSERFCHTTRTYTGEGENRTSSCSISEPFIFPDSFYRLTYDSDAELPEGWSYDEFFRESLAQHIDALRPDVVTIDNLSALVAGDSDQAKTTKPILDYLNRLKKKYGITIIVLEHIKKISDGLPLVKNAIQGSKMKSNLSDACLGLARSCKDPDLRYLKDLKIRTRPEEYGSDNVLLFRLDKEYNRLTFKCEGTAPESDHLKPISEQDLDYLKSEAIRLRAAGLTIEAIGQMLKRNKSTVSRWLKAAGVTSEIEDED